MKEKELAQLYHISIKSYDELLHIQKQHIKEIERLEELNDGLTTEIQKELKGKLKLLDEIERLNNRIDKAIEYIKNNWIEYSDFQYVDNDDELNIDCESIKELYDILKGSDKE